MKNIEQDLHDYSITRQKIFSRSPETREMCEKAGIDTSPKAFSGEQNKKLSSTETVPIPKQP
jgi:hypothetical protein